MRVIAGAQRGRRLNGPQNDSLRPTSDRVREALFSILGTSIQNARVLDLYAGTGAVGIEALSRGAARVTFVESASPARRVLYANLERCALNDKAEVLGCRVEQFLRRLGPECAPFDVVFADPPYEADDELGILSTLLSKVTLADQSVIVLEHAKRTCIPDRLGGVAVTRRYEYGDTCLSLCRSTEESSHRSL